METQTISKSDVMNYIWNANDGTDLRHLNRIIIERIRTLDARTATNFNVGEKVSFDSKRGCVVTGVITKVNGKSICLKEVNLIGTVVNWKVSPSLLRKV